MHMNMNIHMHHLTLCGYQALTAVSCRLLQRRHSQRDEVRSRLESLHFIITLTLTLPLTRCVAGSSHYASSLIKRTHRRCRPPPPPHPNPNPSPYPNPNLNPKP